MARRVPLPMMPSNRPRVIPGIREPAVYLHHDRAADSVAALVTAIPLIVTAPVRVIAVWIVRVVGIRVVEWKRRKEGKAEAIEDNDSVDVVMKSIVSTEAVEPSETRCAVQHCSALHWRPRRCGQHWSTVDWRPSHRRAMPHHLCLRCRDRENA